MTPAWQPEEPEPTEADLQAAQGRRKGRYALLAASTRLLVLREVFETQHARLAVETAAHDAWLADDPGDTDERWDKYMYTLGHSFLRAKVPYEHARELIANCDRGDPNPGCGCDTCNLEYLMLEKYKQAWAYDNVSACHRKGLVLARRFREKR